MVDSAEVKVVRVEWWCGLEQPLDKQQVVRKSLNWHNELIGKSQRDPRASTKKV